MYERIIHLECILCKRALRLEAVMKFWQMISKICPIHQYVCKLIYTVLLKEVLIKEFICQMKHSPRPSLEASNQ